MVMVDSMCSTYHWTLDYVLERVSLGAIMRLIDIQNEKNERIREGQSSGSSSTGRKDLKGDYWDERGRSPDNPVPLSEVMAAFAM